MQEENGPLLFINTVKTDAVAKNQETYDSRESKKQTKEFKEMRKLLNIIEMYHKDRPVLCNLFTSKINVIATPYLLEGSKLSVKTQDGKIEILDVYSIEKIEIIRF